MTREEELHLFPSELQPLGIVGPDFVYLSRSTGALEGPLATVSRGFWGPGDSAPLEAIREKEELLPAYVANTGAEEQWLLLVTGKGHEQATDSVLTEWTREPTAFDRVYLLDLRTGTLQRVDAQAGPPAS